MDVVGADLVDEPVRLEHSQDVRLDAGEAEGNIVSECELVQLS